MESPIRAFRQTDAYCILSMYTEVNEIVCEKKSQKVEVAENGLLRNVRKESTRDLLRWRICGDEAILEMPEDGNFEEGEARLSADGEHRSSRK